MISTVGLSGCEPFGALSPSSFTGVAGLAEVVRRRWPDLDIAGRPVAETILVRDQSPYGYGRASYALNLGRDYGCVH
ncbi:hypothetical protein [Amycolatopsis japonica]